MDNKNYRRLIWTAIAILVIVIVIFAAVVDIDALVETLKGVDYRWLLFGVAFLLLGIVMISIRWRFFLPDKPSFLLTFHSNSISYMLKLLIPIPLAVLRLTIFTLASSLDIYQSAPMLIIERFLEFVMRIVALSMVFILILHIHPWITGAAIISILLLAVPAFIMWFSRNASTAVPRLIERAARSPDLDKKKLRETMVEFQNNVSTMRMTRGLTTGVFYSLGMWGLFLLFYIFGFYSLGLNLDTRKIVAMSAAILAILPPSTPAMIGVYQGIIVAILLAFGLLDVNTATAYGLLITGVQLVVWIVLGVLGFKRTDIKFSKLTQLSLDEQDAIE
jgi:uncharacterized protein (TIRG00374 family)